MAASKERPKILYFDIEWKPATAYVWRMWDENIGPDQLIDAGGLLCFSAIWDDTKEVIFASDWEHGHKRVVKKLYDLFNKADVVITYNGDKYDIPKSMGEFLLAGYTPPPPPASIDLVKVVRNMGFVMNRLAFIGPFLDIGKKVKHEGFPLWTAVMSGDKPAQERMKKYCIKDSKLLVKLYAKIKPYIRNHPFLGDRGACGSCDSKHLQNRGFRRTKSFKIQRLQCQGCGSWQDGKREKV